MEPVYIICGVALILLCVLSDICYRSRQNAKRDGETDSQTSEKKTAAATVQEAKAENDETVCCGKHAVCEKQRIADAMNHRAQYFEDEELDRFSGRGSDEYSDDEIEEFRYVMYTMRQEEVLEWLESLKVRGIELPDELKDEACMMME